MASLPSDLCCLTASLHVGKPKGKLHDSLFSLPAYEAGDRSSKRVIIIATDIFGHDFLNNNLVADAFATKGYYVLMPDILLNDKYDLSQGMDGFSKWKVRHGPEDTVPVFLKFLRDYISSREGEPDLKVFAVGYCFGAPCAVRELTVDSAVTAGAIAHPSSVLEQDVDAVRKPILISAAQEDPAFPRELRYRTEEILVANGQWFEIDLFGKTSHGFAIKGDVTVPEVKYAKEKSFADIVAWFEQF